MAGATDFASCVLQVTSMKECIYDGKLVSCDRIDAFTRTPEQVDDALAQQVMNWRPCVKKQFWINEFNNDCTGYVRAFSKDIMPDLCKLWKPTTSMSQARMCIDWMANAPESRNGFGRPRICINFECTPYHVVFFTHDRKRTLFCASYGIDGSELELRFAIGVLISHAILYGEITRLRAAAAAAASNKKRTHAQHEQETNTTVTEDAEAALRAPEFYFEKLRHECDESERPDTRIDENAKRKRAALEDFYRHKTIE